MGSGKPELIASRFFGPSSVMFRRGDACPTVVTCFATIVCIIRTSNERGDVRVSQDTLHEVQEAHGVCLQREGEAGIVQVLGKHGDNPLDLRQFYLEADSMNKLPQELVAQRTQWLGRRTPYASYHLLV